MSLTNKTKALISFVNDTDGSLIAKTIRGGFWVIISSLGSNGLAFLRSIILARLLLPEVFGLMSICLIVIRGLEVFTQTGFGAALIQRTESFEEARDTAFTLLVFRGFALSLVLFIISPFISHFYQKEILDTAIKVIAISSLLGGFRNINTVAYQKELNFKYLTYLEQIVNFVNFAVVITLAYFFRNVWALIFAHVISTAFDVFLSFVIISPKFRFRFDLKIAKELFAYGKFITALSIVLFIAAELDNVLIAKVLGIDILGYYVLAFTIANLVTTHISKIISGVMFPAYSKLQNNIPELTKYYYQALKVVSFIIIPAAVGITVLAEEIVRTVYGTRWLNAVLPLKILALFGVIRALASINGYVFNGVGKPKYDFSSGLARLVILGLILYPFSYYLGIEGAAIAVTISMIVQYSLGLFYLKRIIPLKFAEVKNLLFKPLLCGAVMGVVVLATRWMMLDVGIQKLLLLIGIGAGTYLLLNRRDAIMIVKNVSSLISK